MNANDWNRVSTDYTLEDTARIRSAVLTIASVLGPTLMDEVVLVGGLVPSLLLEQQPERLPPHVGTLDVDLALSLGVFDQKRYATIAEVLKKAGFKPETKETDEGKSVIVQHCWKIEEGPGRAVLVDFIISRSTGGPPKKNKGPLPTVQRFTRDFGALIMDAMPVAFRDREKRTLEGRTLKGDKSRCDVWVAGHASFVVLKALAIEGRAKGKDAYDLCWMLAAVGPEAMALKWKALPAGHKDRALQILGEKFASHEHEGPRRVVRFEEGADAVNDERAADVVGLVGQFITACGRT